MNGVYFVSLFRAYFVLCVPVQDDEFYEGMGVYFVSLASNLGYGLMLQALYADCIYCIAPRKLTQSRVLNVVVALTENDK